jgi:hypothetical protein
MKPTVCRAAAVIALALLLASCSQWFTPRHSYHPRPQQAKTHYKPDAFVEHLALARLSGDGMAEEDYAVLQAYMAQKPQQSRRQSVLIISYQEDGERSDVAAPVSVDPYNTQFPSLLAILQKLGPRTLHDLRLVNTTVVPTDAFRTAADADAQRIALEQQEQWLISNAEALAPLEEAQAQLQLATFFIDNRFRDAAYLTVDNVKRLLATASNRKTIGRDTLRILSRKLDMLEEQLHKTMPFTL